MNNLGYVLNDMIRMMECCAERQHTRNPEQSLFILFSEEMTAIYWF